jgi:hypothetical protein
VSSDLPPPQIEGFHATAAMSGTTISLTGVAKRMQPSGQRARRIELALLRSQRLEHVDERAEASAAAARYRATSSGPSSRRNTPN